MIETGSTVIYTHSMYVKVIQGLSVIVAYFVCTSNWIGSHVSLANSEAFYKIVSDWTSNAVAAYK